MIGQNNISDLLATFQPFSLSESSGALLGQRFDSKFLFHIRLLPSILNGLRAGFAVLEINQKRLHEYETLYFDSPDFKLFYDHHNGKPNRMKVRVRKYVSSNEVFFEIKHKLKGLKTGKLRLPQQKMMFEIGEEEWHLIRESNKTIQGLEPKLFTNFSRATFKNKLSEERITIDVGLAFNNSIKTKSFGNVVVMEVKHLQAKPSNVVMDLIHQFHLVQTSFSKYATGVALLENNVRYNLFKPTILQLNKTENG